MNAAPKLKSRTITRIEVKYDDLNDFISEVYGQEFNCVASDEWSNDTCKDFKITKEVLGEYDRNKLEEFKKTGSYQYLTCVILTDLCNSGKIPEGNYLIDISW